MKNKWLIFPILAAFLLSSVSAYASFGVQNSSGANQGQAQDLKAGSGITITVDGGVATLGGGAVGSDGNFTSDGLALTADLAPTKFIFTASSGDLAVTQLTASGLTASDVVVTDGSKHLASSSTTAAELAYIHGLTTPTGTGAIVAANTPTLITPVIGAATGTSLVLSGALTSAGLTSSTTLTLQNSETIKNSTNGTIQLGSNSGAAIADIYAAGTSDDDATLSLSADAAADNGDVWRLTSDGATNSLFFENNATGSQVAYMTLTDTGALTVDGITNGLVTIAGDGTSNGTASLILSGDAGADATDRFNIKNDAAGNLTIGNDDTTPGTFVTKFSVDSTGAASVQGSEATAASFGIWADNGDDAADKFKFSMDAADLMTITTGATTAATVSTAGLWTFAADTTTGAALFNGAVTLGDAVTDITTFTGKIAGATPMSFDGVTADTVYTIFAFDDPASASKTITFPAVTGTVKLSSAAVAITAGTTPTITVAKGTTLYTDTITTDDQNQTLAASAGGSAGDEMRIIFVTDAAGSNDEVITFGSNMRSTGTLTLANAAASRYVVSFVSDGTKWNEVSRTAVQAA